MYHVINDRQQEFNGVRYYKCGPYFQKRGSRLHRAVWEYHKGPVPEGMAVHHIDGDKSNNDISNLELKSKSEHSTHHLKEPERIALSKQTIETARIKASEWHGSPEGLEWHSKQGKANALKRATHTYYCDYCGHMYYTKHVYGTGHKFCSNNCKASFRRATHAH